MILDPILENKRVEVESRKKLAPLRELEEKIALSRKPRDFRSALRQEGISLIAEIKRASPSRIRKRAREEPCPPAHPRLSRSCQESSVQSRDLSSALKQVHAFCAGHL